MDSHSWPCPTCADERAFEQPPCHDGHTADGGECPEWVCVGCGTAVFVGPVVGTVEAPRVRRAA